MKTEGSFTIRVYGILVHNQSVLLSRENILGGLYTKFPGGGLEYGEGTLDCLRREFREELGIQVEPTSHLYTTEEFVASAFGNNVQVMSIYYWVSSHQSQSINIHPSPEEAALPESGDQAVFWKPISQLRPADVDLPIDQKVVKLITDQS